MSIAFGMILFGALLIYGGWTNRSIWALSRGDNQTPKPAGAASLSPAAPAARPAGARGPVGRPPAREAPG